MIEFGKTLRAHREAKGLTTSEVAQKTHILVQQVEALEKEDFSKYLFVASPLARTRHTLQIIMEILNIQNN